MEDQNIAVLRNILLNTLSPDINAIKEAERYVRSIEASPGFIIVVLRLISTLLPSQNPQDVAIRLAAAVLFKNAIKRRWSPGPTDSDETTGGPLTAIVEGDRETIKSHLIDLMCTTPPDCQRQLAEAVSIISKFDFPWRWEGLLTQLVEKLSSADINIIKGVMLTANSILKKFRYSRKCDELYREIIFCLNGFHGPLLEMYQVNAKSIEASALNKQQLEILFETRRLMTRIFFSFNWQDLPEPFEDNIEVWMSQFSIFLEYKNPILIEGNSSDPGPIERLQAAIIENINLYASKYDEEFETYLPKFTQLVWQLLMQVTTEVKYDNLATNAIKFLTSVAAKQRNVPLFSDQVLRDIIEHIVVRSLTATEADEELFEFNPTDYIRKDMEGSDQDTRRRCASELVRTLLKFFSTQISQLCTGYVVAMLEQYRVRQDWKAKDAALHLVLAVTILSSSNIHGVSSLNPNINILDVFSTHVLPEIHDLDVNSRPIVKADAIKMICIFRSQLSTPYLLDLIPHLLRHLNSTYVVIQTYSAFCLEKFLSVKDRDLATGSSTNRLTKDHLRPFVQPLFHGLFTVLDNPDLPENDYVMKCVMRMLSLLGRDVASVTQLLLNKFTVTLERVCKNPTNPHFNHYLFESVALLVTSSCQPDPASCGNFEAVLFPPFQAVLTQDVTEFVPYVFQILAQLLSCRPVGSGLSAPYRALFPPLLTPALWERKGNIPALTDLLRAYVFVGLNEIVAGNNLTGVLGVFQKLLAAKSTEASAFKLIDAVFLQASYEAISPFLSTIFGLLLHRLQEQITPEHKTPKYCRYFLHTTCLVACRYGGKSVHELFDSLTPGLIIMIILNVWSNNNVECSTLERVEIREMIAGATNILLEMSLVTHSEAWIALVKYILGLIEAEASGGVPVVDDELVFVDEEAEAREFDSTYSKLAYAQLPEPPSAPEVLEASKYFVTSLAGYSVKYPGQCAALIQRRLTENPKLAQTLQALLQKHGLFI